MSITITSELADEFGRADEPVEVRAPDGRVSGTFTPSPRGAESEITEDELREREDPATGKWYTAAEVEAKLRELRCSQ
jgi:hypothetical protein